MNVTEAMATSGALIGVLVVLLVQQLGLVALEGLWGSLLTFLVALCVGALIFGTAGWLADRR